MARRQGTYRKLVADGHTYLWRVRHTDADGVCEETVILRRYGSPGHARIVFRAGPGRAVGGAYLHSGGVARTAPRPEATPEPVPLNGSASGFRGGGYLNLRRPGVVRALLGQVLAAGWEAGEERKFDGWEMFDVVLAVSSATGGC